MKHFLEREKRARLQNRFLVFSRDELIPSCAVTRDKTDHHGNDRRTLPRRLPFVCLAAALHHYHSARYACRSLMITPHGQVTDRVLIWFRL